MEKVDVGNIWLTEKLICAVNEHKKFMLKLREGSDGYDVLLRADFSFWLSDFLGIYGFYMIDKVKELEVM
jgi:hypothetical protein